MLQTLCEFGSFFPSSCASKITPSPVGISVPAYDRIQDRGGGGLQVRGISLWSTSVQWSGVSECRASIHACTEPAKDTLSTEYSTFAVTTISHTIGETFERETSNSWQDQTAQYLILSGRKSRDVRGFTAAESCQGWFYHLMYIARNQGQFLETSLTMQIHPIQGTSIDRGCSVATGNFPNRSVVGTQFRDIACEMASYRFLFLIRTR